MKRDMDLIRKILMAVEESDDDMVVVVLPVAGYSEKAVARHIELLSQSGLLDAKADRRTTEIIGEYTVHYRINRLTWDGYEFLDLARSPKVWNEAMKDLVEKGAGVSLDVLRAVLIAASMKLMGPVL